MKSVLSEKYIREYMQWVLEEEKPLFKELDGELCIAMKDGMGIGIATHIDSFYKFDDTLLQFLGHNEEKSYFVSLVKQGDKWFINELSIMGVAPTNYGRAKAGVEAY